MRSGLPNSSISALQRGRVCRAAARVVAAVLADLEGGVLPPGNEARHRKGLPAPHAPAAGQDAGLRGRRDARRRRKQMLEHYASLGLAALSLGLSLFFAAAPALAKGQQK